MDMLRGTVTGTIVSRESGAGSSPSIEVHGQRSVNSSNTNPLVVVDGVIFQAGWRFIDPATIESMSVLKDATSLAAYGSQAANGVIMITTKRGKLGKPMISVESSLTVSSKAMTPRLVRPESLIKFQNILRNVNDPKDWMTEHNYQRYQRGEITDWWDFVTRTGVLQNHAVSISGATEKFNYYASLSHTDHKGVVKGDRYSREQGSLRLQNDITDWLQIGTSAVFSYNNYDGVAAGVVNNPPFPWASGYTSDGRLTLQTGDIVGSRSSLWDSEVGVDDQDRRAIALLKGHLLLKAPWITGLSYRMNVSYTYETYNRDRFTHEINFLAELKDGWESDYNEEHYPKYLSKANGSSERTVYNTYVWDNILNYSNNFGKHYIDLTAVYTRDENKYDGRGFSGNDFSAIGNTLLGADGLAFAANQKYWISKNRKANVGYLGRLA